VVSSYPQASGAVSGYPRPPVLPATDATPPCGTKPNSRSQGAAARASLALAAWAAGGNNPLLFPPLSLLYLSLYHPSLYHFSLSPILFLSSSLSFSLDISL